MPDSTPTTPEIAPDYYLTNFQCLVNWVAARYEDLLSAEELQFITQFHNLNHGGQCLFVRLSSRKGNLFRADKLRYTEIDSVEVAAYNLVKNNLLEMESLLTLQEVSSLLTKVELLGLFREELSAHKSQRKEVLIQLLGEKYQEELTWQDWTQNQFSQVYRLGTQQIIDNFLLLFFGNSYQDLTEFVLQDLGLYRYENYVIDRQHRIFKSRAELEEYQHLIEIREQLANASELEELIAIAEQIPASLSTSALEHRRARLCNQLAYEFERWDQHAIAVSLYQQSHLPPARERQVRLLEKQRDYAKAWHLLSEILANPINEHELQVAERMAPRLAKKASIAFDKKRGSSITEKYLILPRIADENGNQFYVEEIVRRHIDSENSPCFYVENQLLSSLFGLWLWPEMFRSREGAFANPFQATPLDMYDSTFMTNRPQIKILWQLFEDDSHREHIRNIWQQKNGITNHFVNWSFIDEKTLELALACIPARHLKLIFERLLFDIKNNRSGLPDLIQFFPETQSYCMIEVKGPGDRIQDNQKRWLDFFLKHEIPAEVVYVSWQ
ncbi:MAG: VRR-NUC domain-containing protein [Gammaproteobacteria bacterium]|nr:MAG: VRR-NUC domain-containing protein [Gammaproteobacteria bacterium]